MRVLLLLTCLVFTSGYLVAQKQNNIWYFGHNAGLDFNTNPPTPLVSEMVAIEGSASISDPAGHLLFYTNGITVWDRNHNVMPNGTGLLGGESSTQAALIVPLPNSTTKFYLFTTEDAETDGGMNYSVVDMNLNSGFGDIITDTKNTLVVNHVAEKVTAILHENGEDIWIVTHRLNSNEFLSYLLTSAGLNLTPVISPIGSFYAYLPVGPIKASHNGSKIVSSSTIDQTFEENFLEMFDFNLSTGEISKLFDINQLFEKDEFVYGIEFSPNDSLLYISLDLVILNGIFVSFLYQIDLGSHQVTTLSTSPFTDYGALQLGPDNQIYMAKHTYGYLDVIRQPNRSGTACQYQENGITLSDSTFSAIGLPNLAPYSLFVDSNAVPSLGSDATLCIGGSKTLKVEFPTNCFPISFLWNDGSTGSELEVNQTGSYWVEMNTTCGRYNDTILVKFISCLPIVHYDLEACTANMQNGSNMDYSEFVPSYPDQLECAHVTASNVFRSSSPENKHSCTSGVGDSVAMCIGSYNSCFYSAGNQASLVIEVLIDPDPDSTVRLTSMEFYERAPVNYNWINGASGLNNYPGKFGLRILKNGIEILRLTDILTNADWTLESFQFLNEDSFLVDDSSVFRIELLPYCPVGNNAGVSAWDIDEIKIFGGCVHVQNPLPVIEGEVLTKEGKPISGVEMQIAGSLSFSGFERKITDDFGAYSFDGLEMANPYYVRGYKNDDVRNGISTLDIIQIRRHILGITPFTSLHQYIAADVNHSGKVTAIDMVELMKLILGIHSEFPHNTSWRFGSLPQEMNGNNISGFREISSIEHMEDDKQVLDFVGIKIGDLNGDVQLQGQYSGIELRNRNELGLIIDDQLICAGIPLSVQVKVMDTSAIAGMQFAIDLKRFEIISLTSNTLPISQDNYSIIDGILRFSWSSEEVMHVSKRDVLFSIVLRSSKDGTLSDMIRISNQFLKPEAYLENLEVVDLSLKIKGLELKSNTLNSLRIDPNPAHSEVNIQFFLEEEGLAEIRFFDVSGKYIYKIQKKYLAGENREKIYLDGFPCNSVIYCQIIANGSSIVEKFVNLN